ncbi:MAG TPA: hypothetical protein DEB09_04590 [Candidatus Magasanikbacteria bacterium]|nr:hypothetical protein [Candidatus Magasanikbacteria bacterium]
MYLLVKLAKYKTIMAIVFTMMFGFFVGAPLMASAAAPQINFGLQYGADTGLGNKDVRSTISSIINVALSLLGIVAVVIILAGGFKWMTAGGNEEKTGEARKMIMAGVIGMAIILSAYAVANFVLKQLYFATTGGDYETDVPTDV